MIAFEKSVGAVIYRKEDGGIKFLLLHYQSGHWDFPKGHVEKAETDEETLRRETREETGIVQLEIKPDFKMTTGYYYEARGDEFKRRIQEGKKTKIKKTVVYYLAETTEIEIKISHEHRDFAWLSYTEALTRITYENGKSVLTSAHKRISTEPPEASFD